MAVVLFLVQHGKGEGERNHMGQVGDIGDMDVVAFRGHDGQPHMEGVIHLFHHVHRILVGLLRIGHDSCPPVEKIRHGRPRAGVFGSSHRVGGHVPSPAGMALDGSGYDPLGGTGVYDGLAVISLIPEDVQHLLEHKDRRIHRDGYYYKVGPVHKGFNVHRLVHQSYRLGGISINRVRIRAVNLVREASPAKVDCHGASYQAQSYDAGLHIAGKLQGRNIFSEDPDVFQQGPDGRKGLPVAVIILEFDIHIEEILPLAARNGK